MNGVLNNWIYICRGILIHYNLLSIPTNLKFGFYTYKYSASRLIVYVVILKYKTLKVITIQNSKYFILFKNVVFIMTSNCVKKYF